MDELHLELDHIDRNHTWKKVFDTLDSNFDKISQYFRSIGSRIKIDTFTAAEGQTEFHLSSEYSTRRNSLAVYLNDARQFNGSGFNETSKTSFELVHPCEQGDKVIAVYMLYYVAEDNRDFDQLLYEELEAARVGWDGTVYGSLSDAIHEQISKEAVDSRSLVHESKELVDNALETVKDVADNEKIRVENEETRQSNEKTRVDNEESREIYEKKRRDAEDARSQWYEGIKDRLDPNAIPIATTGYVGLVKPDGTTITIDEFGTIKSTATGSTGGEGTGGSGGSGYVGFEVDDNGDLYAFVNEDGKTTYDLDYDEETGNLYAIYEVE